MSSESFPLPELEGARWPGGLRFTYGSLLALEREQGKGVRNLFSTQSDFEICGLLITYGLRHAAPKITLAQVVKLIDRYIETGGSLNDLYKVALEALNACGILQGLGGKADEDDAFLVEDEDGSTSSDRKNVN